MKILALDLGTKTGYAYNPEGAPLEIGTWTLAKPKEITEWGRTRQTRTRDPRIRRLWEKIIMCPIRADIVIFEDVEFSSYTKQTQLWASFRTVLWMTFSRTRIECVPVGTLKKFATGHGGATKQMMRFAFRKRPGFQSAAYAGLDDNAIDAYWLWAWANEHLKI